MTRDFRLVLVVVAVWLAALLTPVCAARVAPGAPVDSSVETVEPAIRGGSIVLKVSDYSMARSEVIRLAEARDALLSAERSEANYTGERHGEIVLELDAAELKPLMEEVRRIGKLYSELVQTADRTSDYQKLGTRISLLKQNEGELLGFMHGSRRLRGSDILYVQSRLYDSRVMSANAAQERVDIARRSRRAMLSVELFEPEPRKTFDWGNWRAAASYRAKGSFLYVLRKAVTGSFYALYFAPIWIPAALVLFFGGRKVIRGTKRWGMSLWDRWKAYRARPVGEQ